jgi:hypothetical protein
VIHIPSTLLCACDGLLLFWFSPVLVSSVRKEVVRVKMPIMLHGGTVQHFPPVNLPLDPVELAVMQHNIPNFSNCAVSLRPGSQTIAKTGAKFYPRDEGLG